MNADTDPNKMIPRTAYRQLLAKCDGYRDALLTIAHLPQSPEAVAIANAALDPPPETGMPRSY